MLIQSKNTAAAAAQLSNVDWIQNHGLAEYISRAMRFSLSHSFAPAYEKKIITRRKAHNARALLFVPFSLFLSRFRWDKNPTRDRTPRAILPATQQQVCVYRLSTEFPYARPRPPHSPSFHSYPTLRRFSLLVRARFVSFRGDGNLSPEIIKLFSALGAHIPFLLSGIP